MGGAILGPVVAAVLLSRFWWGSVFLLAVPVSLMLLVAGPALLPSPAAAGDGRLDLLSVLQSLLAVLAMVYAVKEAALGRQWTAPLAALLVGGTFAALFIRRQRRLTHPLLDLDLFRQPVLRSTVLVSTAVGALQGGTLLVANLDLQRVRGHSPLASGLLLVPPALCMLAGVVVATRLGRTRRPGPLIAAGLAVCALGNVAIASGILIPGLCLVMAGVGPMVSLGYGIVVSAAPAERAGAAAGVMETGGQLGIAIGVAVLGSVASIGTGHPDRVLPVAVLCAVTFAGLSAVAAVSLRQAQL